MAEALEDMITQFGYQTIYDGKPCITTGGLSALESAFDALGWVNPHFIPEEGYTCEIDGCMRSISSGQKWGKLYLMLCSNHGHRAFLQKRRPKVKKYALERELKRDKKTGILKK